MDMFDSSDEEDSGVPQQVDATCSDKVRDAFSLALCNILYVELMRLKPKVPVCAANDSNIVLDREIAVVIDDGGSPSEHSLLLPTAASFSQLQGKVRSGKIKNVTYYTVAEFLRIPAEIMFDIVVCVTAVTNDATLKSFSKHLMPKGIMLSYDTLSSSKIAYTDNDWVADAALYREVLSGNADPRVAGVHVVCIPKRAAHCNQAGALYWPNLRSAEHIALEKKIIEEVSVTLSAQEVSKGVFSTTTHDSAVRILNQYGVCVFPRLFVPGDVLRWGKAGRADMLEAIQRLRVGHQVDLLAADVEGEISDMPNVVRDNFHELSMREAYRCDLRNSPRMKALHAQLPKQLAEFQKTSTAGSNNKAATGKDTNYVTNAGAMAALSTPSTAGTVETKASKINAAVERCVAIRPSNLTSGAAFSHPAVPPGVTPEMRYNRGLLGVLTETMNPVAPQQPAFQREDVNIEHGNWGKWNFSGPGPGSFNGPCIGKMGTIVSLPRCKDQTIHADAAHIFEHVHLPGHYVNLFMPCVLPHNGDSPISLDTLTPRTTAAVATKTMDTEDEVYVDEEAELRAMLQENPRLPPGQAPSTCYLQGQTAYVVGTHQMTEAAIAMTHADAQEYLEARLIRPQLTAGDALLFDCRVLHFGLSNWSQLKRGPVSEEDWRLMLYVNYHQQWFQDPKNWNDEKKLF